jgi:alcohol dehydrogenase class IV
MERKEREEGEMYPLTDVFAFRAPTSITFGAGALSRLATVVGVLGRRPLVVSDPGIAGAGILQQVLDALRALAPQPETFSDVEPNPSIETVDRAAAVYRRGDCDCLVAVGGGSAMDVAKVVAVLAAHGGGVLDYEGIGKVPGPAVPVICVPTTAGTGSEVTQFAVITDRARPFKLTVGGPHLVPAAAVCDPGLTLSMPPPLTAATGMDALTHGIECYVNTATHPLAKTYALEAIRLIGRHLRTAYATGQNLDARYHMLLASTMAALAFTHTRLGNVHAMSHPLGAHFDVPHGVANAVLLPYVMEWNLIAGMETYPRIAEALGEPVAGLPPREAAEAAVEAVRQLAADVSIPERLRDVGVTRDAVPVLADDAMKSGNVLVNPRLTRREDIVHLFERAF